jgi:hypothetical protein
LLPLAIVRLLLSQLPLSRLQHWQGLQQLVQSSVLLLPLMSLLRSLSSLRPLLIVLLVPLVQPLLFRPLSIQVIPLRLNMR